MFPGSSTYCAYQKPNKIQCTSVGICINHHITDARAASTISQHFCGFSPSKYIFRRQQKKPVASTMSKAHRTFRELGGHCCRARHRLEGARTSTVPIDSRSSQTRSVFQPRTLLCRSNRAGLRQRLLARKSKNKDLRRRHLAPKCTITRCRTHACPVACASGIRVAGTTSPSSGSRTSR